MHNRFNLLGCDIEVAKALDLPSLLIRRKHRYLFFFHRVHLAISGLLMTFALKLRTYKHRVSSKFIEVWDSLKLLTFMLTSLTCLVTKKVLTAGKGRYYFLTALSDLPHSFCSVTYYRRSRLTFYYVFDSFTKKSKSTHY